MVIEHIWYFHYSVEAKSQMKNTNEENCRIFSSFYWDELDTRWTVFEVDGSMVSTLVHNTLQLSSGSKPAVTQRAVQHPLIFLYWQPQYGLCLCGPSDFPYAHCILSRMTIPCGIFCAWLLFLNRVTSFVYTEAPPFFTQQQCHCIYTATHLGIGAVPISD